MWKTKSKLLESTSAAVCVVALFQRKSPVGDTFGLYTVKTRKCCVMFATRPSRMQDH